MKKCPFCAEEIQDEAIKCKYCGEYLKKEDNISSLTKKCSHCGTENNCDAFRCKNLNCLSPFSSTPYTDVTPVKKNYEISTKKGLVIILTSLFIIPIIYFVMGSCSRSNNRSQLQAMQDEYRKNCEKIMKKAERYPNDPEALMDRGSLYLGEGKLDLALADYNKAIGINPNNGSAYNERAGIYFERREYDKAWKDVHKAQALGYEIVPLFLEVLRRESSEPLEQQELEKGLDEQAPDEAIAKYTKALQINPRFADAYYFRGHAYVKKDNLDQAISDFTKAIEINPSYGAAYYMRALVYFTKHEYDKSWKDVIKAKSLKHEIKVDFLQRLIQFSGSNLLENNEMLKDGQMFYVKDLTLDGIIIDKDGKMKAMIKSRIISEGDSIGKIRIDKINKDSIDIIVDGQKKNIKVGTGYK